MKLLNKIYNGLKLLKIDPDLFFKAYKNRNIRRKFDHEKKYIDYTVEYVKREVKKNNYKKILVVSDNSFYQDINEQKWHHYSYLYDDKYSGGNELNIAEFDAIIVGGKEVKAIYIHILRLLSDLNISKPVLWVGEGFEFAGSTIAVIEEMQDAHIYLFNHYHKFFMVNDPILVKYKISDDAHLKEGFVLLNKNQSLRLVLRKFLPNQVGSALIEVSTTHPVLTKGRHNRWRLWADVFYSNSIASSHGAHDYTLAHTVSTRLAHSIAKTGSIAYTLPNYDLSLCKNEQDVYVLSGSKKTKYTRSLSKVVDRVDLEIKSEAGSNLGVMYIGSGDSFLYVKERNTSDTVNENIMLNHNCSQNIFDNNPKKINNEIKSKILNYRSSDIAIHPHALPVLNSTSDFEFGFGFDGCNPPIRFFILHIYDKNGKKIKEINIDNKKDGYLYASEILEDGLGDGGLILIEPNFIKHNFDPFGFNCIGDLVVRNKVTEDKDFTEYQSCWRNIGLITSEFPHWLANYKLINGTTNLVGKLENSHSIKSSIVIVNASGNLRYAVKAIVEITLFKESGDSMLLTYEIPPFTSKILSVQDLVVGSHEFSTAEYYSCIVNSNNADLNVQVVTQTQNGAISLQHLWGY